MAAFTGTPSGSTQYAAALTPPGTPVASADWGSKLRCSYFSYTHTAGAGTGEVNLVRLPAGRVRVLTDLSRLVTSAFAANADIHIGARAYTNEAGTAVVEDDNLFLDNGDAASGLDTALVLPASGSTQFQSQTGVVLFAMIDTGNIENDDTIEGYIIYQMGN